MYAKSAAKEDASKMLCVSEKQRTRIHSKRYNEFCKHVEFCFSPTLLAIPFFHCADRVHHSNFFHVTGCARYHSGCPLVFAPAWNDHSLLGAWAWDHQRPDYVPDV